MKSNKEFEQSIIRISIIGLLITVLLFKSNGLIENSILLCIAYMFVAALTHMTILHRPDDNKVRQWFCMFMDVSLTSFEFILLGEFGGILIGIYLWLIVGYGLRYGANMLKGASVFSVVCFTYAYTQNSYFSGHMALLYGLILTLILIPLHALRLLKQLTNAQLKAEAANQAKSQFLSHISHEIRTPLNGIVGGMQLLLGTKLKVDQKHYAHIINNSAELLMQLVSNVLDISQIEKGKMSVTPAEFNISELVAITISLFEPQVNKKNIELNYEIWDSVPMALIGDQLHIKQILVNLLANAIKFTNQGSVNLTVKTLTNDITETLIRFEIIDTGQGIKKEALPHIFESFTQADDSIKFAYGGTGLGTTISKELVELMGGSIGAESDYGVGSTFWFELKFAKPITNNSEITPETINPQLAKSQIINSDVADYGSTNIVSMNAHSKRRNKYNREINILVADDSEINLTIVSKVLTNAGYRVNTAKDGEVALDLLELVQFDLMILDNNMPIIGGMEVIKTHRMISIGQPRIPIIVLSADATKRTIHAFEELGVDAYLTKPVDVKTLIGKVEFLLELNHKDKYTGRDDIQSAQIIDYSSKSKTLTISYLDTRRLDNLALLGDSNMHFLNGLIVDFMSDAEKNLEVLKTSLSKNDIGALVEVGHTLAGIAADVGAKELEKLAIELNNVTHSDELELIDSLSKKIDLTYKLTKNELEKYIKTKSSPSIH
ncbi:ATP-binding protein [Methylotenera sp.]|uniref:ATP-binding protein n=1 Tax=Methylotenera sp. TaxID=2051956 RepID=UPI0024896342|nr:ATP-binding protein [Methylotenera sp.]MDI1298632.1 ATP-binding protein [Methylotenera sp.]